MVIKTKEVFKRELKKRELEVQEFREYIIDVMAEKLWNYTDREGMKSFLRDGMYFFLAHPSDEVFMEGLIYAWGDLLDTGKLDLGYKWVLEVYRKQAEEFTFHVGKES